MIDNLIFDLVFLFFLILLSGVFSGAEIAFFSLSKASIHTLIRKKYKGSEKLLQIKQKPNRLLLTILIGNTICNILASSLATYLISSFVGSWGVGLATGIMTLLILTFGEFLPKAFFNYHARTVALFLAPFFYYLEKIFYPVSFLFENLLNFLNKFCFKNNSPKKNLYKEDLRSLAYLAYREGILVKNEHSLLNNLLHFNNNVVLDIAKPLEKVHFFYADKSLADYKEYLEKSPYSRIPVLTTDLKVKGILYIRDLVSVPKRQWKNIKVSLLCKPAVLIDANKTLDYTLSFFKKRHTHLFVVMRGEEIYGIVTLEDVLERLVGDIQDETDLLAKHSKALLGSSQKI